jgi:hypothetical protein
MIFAVAAYMYSIENCTDIRRGNRMAMTLFLQLDLNSSFAIFCYEVF